MYPPVLRGATALLITNPATVDPKAHATAAELLRDQPVAARCRNLLEAGDLAELERLVLALGHLQACASPDDPSDVLDTEHLPERVLRRLPRPRGAYLRLVMAAGRCRRALQSMAGRSEALQRVRADTWAACFGRSLHHALRLERVIHEHDVLVQGETGAGKEGVARAIQLGTPSQRGFGPAPSAAVNAAAIPDTLIESELFGHVKGAFTGAGDDRTGRIRATDGGCFFLDEIGDLPISSQVKLLRVIETDMVQPVGSDEVHHADVRYVAATHQDLGGLATRGEFRRDLYERIAGIRISIPPLRARPEDVYPIGMSFVRHFLPDDGMGEELRDDVEAWLRTPEARNYAWPGNVRELQNAVRNRLLGLEVALHGQRPEHSAQELPPPIASGTATLRAASDWYLRRVFEQTEGNYAEAARVLGVDRGTVRRRLEQMRQ